MSELDELFFRRDEMRRAKSRAFWPRKWFTVWLLFYAIAIAGASVVKSKWIAVAVLPFLVSTCWMLWYGVRFQIACDRYFKLLGRASRDVPFRLLTSARVMYPDEWELAAIECHTAHMPGDCPLCGAT